MVSVLDENNIFIYQNPACEKMLGYKPEELIGHKNREFVHPDDIPLLRDRLKQGEASSDGTLFSYFRYKHKKGHWIYIDSVERNMLDNPAVRGRVYYSRDVTKRWEMELENRRSRSVFETSFNVSHTINTITDPKTGEFLDVNDTWETALGWTREEAMGRTANDLNIWGTPENRSRIIGQLSETGSLRNFETSLYGRDGEKRDVLLSAEILKTMGKERLFFSAVDITDLKHAAKKLQSSELRYRRLFDNAEVSIWDQDFSQLMIALDRLREMGVTDIVEYFEDNKDEAFRLADLVVINSVNSATRELYDISPEEEFFKTLAGIMTGETIYVFEGVVKVFWEGGDYYTTEVSHKTGSGKDISVLLSIPIPKSLDEAINVPVTVLDVTERKRLEQQSRRSQRMEAVGQLTGGIAHDFNNILGIVMGNLELLEMRISEDPVALKRLKKAMNGVERGAGITRKLLGFSRKTAEDLSVTKLNYFIDTIEELIAKSLTATIEVKTHLAENLWNVTVDLGDLEDALLNLAINARDAMPSGGTLIIETANKTLDENYVKQNPDVIAGEYVMIAVSDTGMGMSDDIKDHILEPFFSTKETGKGTGLGLSIVYGFIQRSGGHLKIYSELGHGATFRLYLPRTANADADPNKGEVKFSQLPKGRETILVVDDEEVLRDIATTVLQGLGYRTYAAENGKVAMQILKANSDIDLLFSDVIMPGEMDGYELAQSAHDAYPHLNILLTSGFTKKRAENFAGDEKFLSEIDHHLLDKPYNKSDLAFAVRNVFNTQNNQ